MAATATPTPVAVVVPIVVRFKAGISPSQQLAAVGSIGGAVEHHLAPLRTIVIGAVPGTEGQLSAAYQASPLVESVRAPIPVAKAGAPSDPLYPQQWALPKISWDKVYGSVPIAGSAIVAILDTGIDASQPDLAGRLAAGQSFINGNPGVDSDGHGTAMAGIVAAIPDNRRGVAGVAYAGASVSSVQVLKPDGTGLDSDVVAGLIWAADSGAKVALLALSSPQYSEMLAEAVQYAESKGMVVVAATGNNGSAQPNYPASLSGVIGVTATDANDHLVFGANKQGAVLAAPGYNVLSTAPHAAYDIFSGTSVAAAHVAGAAALLAAEGKTPTYIYNQLLSSADPLSGQDLGRLDLARALGPALAPKATPTPIATSKPGTDTVIYHQASLSAVQFTGTAGQSVETPLDGSLTPATGTLAAWVKTTGGIANGVQELVAGRGNAYPQLGVNGGYAFASYNTNGFGFQTAKSSARVDDGAWHHIAGIWDSTSLAIYVDGQLSGSTAPTAGPPYSVASGCYSTSFDIGGFCDATQTFSGLIDEVQLWSRELTSTEIQTYASTAPQGNESGLVAFWPMSEGSGGTTAEIAGHRTSTLVGTGIGWATSQPHTCQDVRNANSSAGDGDYTLYNGQHSFTVYCYNMASAPTEYLTLVHSGAPSSAPFAGSLTGWGFSSGSNYASLWANGTASQVVTSYTKLRLDPLTLRVTVNDATFSTTTGTTSASFPFIPYATSEGCGSDGFGNIDLTGTPFAVSDVFAPAPGTIYVNGQISGGNVSVSNAQVVNIGAEGGCGGVTPAAFRYWLTPPLPYLQLAFASNSAPHAAPAYANAVLSDTPAGYWRLDETSGLTAGDSSAHGLTGTMTAGVSLQQAGALADPTDSSDTAAAFDGATGSVTIPSGPQFNSSDFSVEGWFSTTSTNPVQDVWMSGYTGGNADVEMVLYSGHAGCYFRDTAGQGATVQSNGLQSDGAWHHLACTRSSSLISLYVDGLLAASVTMALGDVDDPGATATIGSSTSAVNYFNGYLDEIAAYGHALSAQRIAAHYAAGIIKKTYPLAGTAVPLTLTGVSSNACSAGFVFPANNAGSAVVFPSVPDVPFSVDHNTNPSALVATNLTGTLCTSLATASPTISISINQAGNTLYLLGSASGDVPQPDSAFSVVVTYADATQDTPSLVEDTSRTTTGLIEFASWASSGHVLPSLAAYQAPVTNVGGGIAYSYVYEIPLDPSKITSTVSITANSTYEGFIYAATLDAVAAPPTGTGGRGLQFNGSSMEYAAAAGTSMSVLDNWTMEAWVNWAGPNSGGTYQYIFGNGSTGGGYDLHVDAPSGTAFAGCCSSSGLPNELVYIEEGSAVYRTGAVLPYDGQWHHLAVERASGSVTVYLDGVAHSIGATNPVAVSGGVSAGNLTYEVAAHEFYGSIDEIRFWDTPVSQAALQGWSHTTLTASHPNYANLKGYWKFEDGAGTTAVDSIGANSATLSATAPRWIMSAAPLSNPNPTAPGAPASVTAVSGPLSASLSWTAPASTGTNTSSTASTISSYTITTLVNNTAVGTPTVTSSSSATISGLTAGTAYSFSVTATNAEGMTGGGTQSNAVTPSGPPATAANSTVAVSPSSVLADGSSTATVTVTLLDSTNSPASGKTVTLSPSGGSSIIGPSSGLSDANGVVTFQVTDTAVETVTYSATDATDTVSISQTGMISFVAGPVSAAVSTVASAPASVPADGATTSTITVTLKDAQSHPLSGLTVALAATAGSSTIGSPSGASNAIGIVTFPVRDTTVENVTYSATDTTDAVALTQTATVAFTMVPTPTPTSVPAPTPTAGSSAPAPAPSTPTNVDQTVLNTLSSAGITVDIPAVASDPTSAAPGDVPVPLAALPPGGLVLPDTPQLTQAILTQILTAPAPVPIQAALNPTRGGVIVAGNVALTFPPEAFAGLTSTSGSGSSPPPNVIINIQPRPAVPIPGGPAQFSPNGTILDISITDANTGKPITVFSHTVPVVFRPNAADIGQANGNFNDLAAAYVIDENSPELENPLHFPIGTFVLFPPSNTTVDPTNGTITVETQAIGSPLSVVTNPIGYVQTTNPDTQMQSSFDPGTSQTFGSKPQFSYLQVVEPQVGTRLLVLDPATNNYAYVNASDVGPSGPPQTQTATAVVRGLLTD